MNMTLSKKEMFSLQLFSSLVPYYPLKVTKPHVLSVFVQMSRKDMIFLFPEISDSVKFYENHPGSIFNRRIAKRPKIIGNFVFMSSFIF